MKNGVSVGRSGVTAWKRLVILAAVMTASLGLAAACGTASQVASSAAAQPYIVQGLSLIHI